MPPTHSSRQSTALSVQLLVSVANADDARAALEGGADIIDAKDPQDGPLGAVTLDAFTAIAAAVRGARPLSAALGEPADERQAATLATAFTGAGAAFVKVGFSVHSSTADVKRLLRTAGANARGLVVAVAYADAATDLTRMRVVEAAAEADAAGVLLDTADKSGPGLCDLLTQDQIRAWTAYVTAAGLRVALAGKLTLHDVGDLSGGQPSIIGVRSAACEGGRTGRVVRERVEQLKAATRRTPPEPSAIRSGRW